MAVLGLWAAAGPPLAAAAPDACPNAAIRAQQGSADLPECRAFEVVSPADKADGDISNITSDTFAATDGRGVAFMSVSSYGDAPSNGVFTNYRARRGDTGWTTAALTPSEQQPGGGLLFYTSSAEIGFSADLSRSVLRHWGPLNAGDPADEHNLYLRKPDGTFTLLTPAPLDPSPADFVYAPAFAGASPDFRHIYFESAKQFTPEAISGVLNLYEWTDGVVTLAGTLPDGTVPAGGTLAGTGASGSFSYLFSPFYSPRAIAADGSRAFFTADPLSEDIPGVTAGPPMGRLYVRTGDQTDELTLSHRDTPETPVPAQFETAATDGSIAYFTSSEKLTNDSTAGGPAAPLEGPARDLYRYDVVSKGLVDITVDTADANGAQVTGVVGASADGSSVYFTARGALAAGAQAGVVNLYRWRDDGGQGETTFIAVAPERAAYAYDVDVALRSARISPDGRFLLFGSRHQTGAGQSDGYRQLYLYDATTQTTTCVSCAPDGSLPTGDASIVGGDSPGTTPPISGNLPRNLSDDGSRVFFNAESRLLPQDTNNVLDVYEYSGGALHLLTDGKNTYNNYFANATPSGDDAFIVTRAALVAGDRDDQLDLYDVRVGGGFPDAPAGPAACVADACRPAGPPPVAPVEAATVTFSGSGNAAPPAPDQAPGRATITTGTRSVRGSSFRVAVRAPGAGRIATAGVGLVKVSRTATRAGTYHLTLRLTASAKKSLRRKHRLAVRARVTFAPASGPAVSTTLSVTLKA